MERLVRGDIVSLHFPFSDLSGSKIRPALVIATCTGEDLLLAQITSQLREEPHTIPIQSCNLSQGTLPHTGYIRTHKIFTADTSLIIRKVARVNTKTLHQTLKQLRTLFT